MPTINSTYTKSSNRKNLSQADWPAPLNGPKKRYVATANKGPSIIRQIFIAD